MSANEKAAFTVKVGEREYNVWADGRFSGFGDGDAPITVVNRIPILLQEARDNCLLNANAAEVRMQCSSMTLGLAGSGYLFQTNKDAIDFADSLAQYVLTGKKPGAEG